MKKEGMKQGKGDELWQGVRLLAQVKVSPFTKFNQA